MASRILFWIRSNIPYLKLKSHVMVIQLKSRRHRAHVMQFTQEHLHHDVLRED